MKSTLKFAYVNVMFNFVGESFDLEYVSKMMKMEPASFGFEQTIRGHKETSWTIDTGKIVTLDLQDGLACLLALLSPLENTIKQIQCDLGIMTTISIEVHGGEDGIPGIWFDSRFLEFSRNINAKFVDVDLYV